MMSLLFPLGLLLGISIPAVIVLYLLKVRRTDHPVSSTFLWRSMPRDLAAQEPLQRLRPSVLLLLQLLVLALLTLALARPAITVAGRPPQDLVLLLDASASMQAIDDGQTVSRFERARAAAEEAIASAPEDSRFTVVEARGQPQVLLSREASPTRALEAVRQARVSGASAQMSEALLLARSLASSGSARRVLVFTDRAFSLPVVEQAVENATIEVVGVGGESANLAITALGARNQPGDHQVQDVYVRLEHLSSEPSQATVELLVGGQPRERRGVDLLPDQPSELVFEGVPTSAGFAEIAVVPSGDALPLDDIGYMALQARRPSRILLVSTGDARLERALALVRGAEVYRVLPQRYLATDVDRFDVVVFDRDVPPILPRGNALILGPSGTSAFLPPGEDRQMRPQALTWEMEDPLLRYVDLRGLNVRRARALEPPTWARTLGWADDAPIMLAGHDPVGRRIVVLGFTPSDSNLPLLPAFPILINNLMEWLAPPALVSMHQLPTGGTTDLTPLARARDLMVTLPGGGSEQVILPVSGDSAPVSFGATDRPGIYSVEQRAEDGSVLPDSLERFAVNLTDSAESDLRPRADSVATANAGDPPIVPLAREFWYWLLALALPLLALEGWWYHRR